MSLVLVAGEIVHRIHKERISALATVPRVLDLMQSYLLDRFPDLDSRVAASQGMKAWKRWWRFRDVHQGLRSQVLGVCVRGRVASVCSRAVLECVGICRDPGLWDDGDDRVGQPESSLSSRARHDRPGTAGPRSAAER